MPIFRRLPKRGFWNPFRKEYAPVNLGALEAAVAAGKPNSAQPIDEAELRAPGWCEAGSMACSCSPRAKSRGPSPHGQRCVRSGHRGGGEGRRQRYSYRGEEGARGR